MRNKFFIYFSFLLIILALHVFSTSKAYCEEKDTTSFSALTDEQRKEANKSAVELPTELTGKAPKGGSSADSLSTILNESEGDWEVKGTAPEIKANDSSAILGTVSNQMTKQAAPSDGAGAAQFTGITTGIGGTVSTISGYDNFFNKAGQAKKREKVYNSAIGLNIDQYKHYEIKKQEAITGLRARDVNSPAYKNPQIIHELERAQNNIKSEVQTQRAEAAKYRQQKGQLKMQGAIELVTGVGMLGTSAANFFMKDKMKDGGGMANDDLFGDGAIPNITPFDPGFVDDGFRGDNPAVARESDDLFGDNTKTDDEDKKKDGKDNAGSGGGGSGGFGGSELGKFEDDPNANSGELASEEKELDSGAQEKVLGSYGDGGRDVAGLGGGLSTGDIDGLLGDIGGDGFNSEGLDNLLASLMPPAGEENELFGPDLDPNKINEQDIDLFTSIKKTHLAFYSEWQKLDEKRKKKGEPEKTKIAKTEKSPTLASQAGDDAKGDSNE